MELDFVDMATMAKLLGVTEAVVRARALSGKMQCYVYVAGDNAQGSQEDFLPPWSLEDFPHIRWRDHGTIIDASRDHGRGVNLGRSSEHREPRYTVTGWVVLGNAAKDEVLTGKTVNLHHYVVGIESAAGDFLCPLTLFGQTTRIVNGDDWYDDQVATTITASDICFLSNADDSANDEKEDPRRIKNLLRIIRALDVMANLPQRGAATPLEAQLRLLGFNSPNDETIRKVVTEVRSLAPDKPQ